MSGIAPSPRSAVAGVWTRRYLRVLAVIMMYGASVHVGNIFGVTGTPWGETPSLWRVMDVVLLLFDLVVAVGLWTRRRWSVVLYLAGTVALQVVPYTLFRSRFVRGPADAALLDGLLATQTLLVAVLLLLLVARK